jgi:hypothetical protein
VPHREDKHKNDKIEEESSNLAEQCKNTDAPGRYATPGRHGSAAPRSTPG